MLRIRMRSPVLEGVELALKLGEVHAAIFIDRRLRDEYTEIE